MRNWLGVAVGMVISAVAVAELMSIADRILW